jgi:hypothetical protein
MSKDWTCKDGVIPISTEMKAPNVAGAGRMSTNLTKKGDTVAISVRTWRWVSRCR